MSRVQRSLLVSLMCHFVDCIDSQCQLCEQAVSFNTSCYRAWQHYPGCLFTQMNRGGKQWIRDQHV